MLEAAVIEPKEIQTLQHIRDYEQNLFKEHLRRLGFAVIKGMADNFLSISEANVHELAHIDKDYQNSIVNLQQLGQIYNGKLLLPEQLEQEISQMFGVVVRAEKPQVISVVDFDGISKAFIQRIKERRQQFKKAIELAERIANDLDSIKLLEVDQLEAIYIDISNQVKQIPLTEEKALNSLLFKTLNRVLEEKPQSPLLVNNDILLEAQKRINRRRLELKKTLPKKVEPKPQDTPKESSGILFGYKNTSLNEDVKKRLIKISKKSRISLKPIERRDWHEHARKSEKKIKKLSMLEPEKHSEPTQFKQRHLKEKRLSTGEIKYTAAERLQHFEVKRNLYKDMHFVKGDHPNTYVIQEVDPNTRECKMEVAATYHHSSQKVEIIANKMDNEDHYILTMVEQAREVAKRFIDKGQDPALLFIKIEDCASYPETAIKLQNALDMLGFKSKFDENTRISVDNYKEMENKKQVPN